VLLAFPIAPKFGRDIGQIVSASRPAVVVRLQSGIHFCVEESLVESVVSKPVHLKKTRLAASLTTVLLGCVSASSALAQVPVVPPPLFSYAGDPGTAGNPASWRTTEFTRDWGLRAMSAEFAYAAGFAGAGMNVGVVDSGYFVGHTAEHAGPTGDRWISVTVTGGTTGPTPGFYNQTYNDSHGTHVSGTVGAARDGRSLPPTGNPPTDQHARRVVRHHDFVRQHT
jgi:subtilisin family serine protease